MQLSKTRVVAFAAPNRLSLFNSLHTCTPWSVFQDGSDKSASPLVISHYSLSLQRTVRRPLALLICYRSSMDI